MSGGRAFARRHPMKGDFKKALGEVVTELRSARGQRVEDLALDAGLDASRLLEVERGLTDPTVVALGSIAEALGQTLGSLIILVEERLGGASKRRPLTVNPAYINRAVPLPRGLTHDQLEAALNRTMAVLEQVGLNPAGGDIQWNIYSGVVSNVVTKAIAEVSSFVQNKDTKYPDLFNPELGGEEPDWGLEIKATNRVAKGGESHNPGRGWFMVVVYQVVGGQTIIVQVETCLLELGDWVIHERKGGSERTRTAQTVKSATQRLRRSSVYLDPAYAPPGLKKLLRGERNGVLF